MANELSVQLIAIVAITALVAAFAGEIAKDLWKWIKLKVSTRRTRTAPHEGEINKKDG
jgi:hypothetical protein